MTSPTVLGFLVLPLGFAHLQGIPALKLHDKFDEVEGVGAEIVHDGSLGCNSVFTYAKLFDNDFLTFCSILSDIVICLSLVVWVITFHPTWPFLRQPKNRPVI